MDKYKKNLKVEGDKVFSYNAHVATIQGGVLLVHGFWSVTTSKHVNYVARELGLTVVKGEKKLELEAEKDSVGHLKLVAGIARLGEVFGEAKTQKEKNDWKARMLKAGLEKRGLMMPDDWDSLSESEKERRLNGVLEIMRE